MSLIFVVDDDPDVRELVEYKLGQDGHDGAERDQRAGRVAPRARRAARACCCSTS